MQILLSPVLLLLSAASLNAQSAGRAGTITGTVTDPSSAVVAGAKVDIQNRVTGYSKSATTDQSGDYRFTEVPPNNYHMTVTAGGFQTFQQDVVVRTSVPITLDVALNVASEVTSVDVHSDVNDLLESVPTAHMDMDSSTFSKLPLTNPGNGLNETLTFTPGVVKDSNGFGHPQGDHGEIGFSVDNQAITDQQSKQFSTSMPVNAIQSMEVISGAPPAEFGDKGSLVVNASTKSGLGAPKSFGGLTFNYGSFGTYGENFSYGGGNAKVGNFLVANAVRSGRYLDSPEFSPLHDRGNNETIFDRFDFAPTTADTFHLNLFFSRAWFQSPNTYDQQTAGQDQRQQIRSFNIAPGYAHVFGPELVLNVTPFFRHDESQYFPSSNPFADQPATVAQNRTLGNAGIKADLSYVHGIHNAKLGFQAQSTFLTENFNFGITDPNFIDPAQQPGLLPFDLTRGGTRFQFHGHTDIKQQAAYLQDTITIHELTIQAGVRADNYRGLAGSSAIEPRLGVSYLFKPTATVIRLSYSRFFETPYNENLILSSSTGAGGLANNSFGSFGVKPLTPGRRNQYNVGMEQGIGKLIVVDAGYFWKYTRNAFDFDNLFNSPIAFPIEWRKSKIDGLSARINLTDYHGFSAFSVLSHTRARFFGPENGGLLFNAPISNAVFRIDHDQNFQQTTNLRYQHGKNGPWMAFTWRYDSGLVVGRVPDVESAYSLSGDQQASIGFHCGNVFASISNPITTCAGGNASARLVRIPPPGKENNDTNPARVTPHHLFDVAAGTDNLFHTERPRFTFQITAENLTNQVALYNFLSTFSGTHFIAPRNYTMEIGMVW